MVDETTDTSNTEQMVVCLRFVDNNLKVHEEVVGLYSLESNSAQAYDQRRPFAHEPKNRYVLWPMLRWDEQHVWIQLRCRYTNSFARTQGTLHTLLWSRVEPGYSRCFQRC